MTHKPATPLPWTLSSEHVSNPNWHPTSLFSFDRLIARVDLTNGPSGEDGAANAAYIVAACNAFPELVAALRNVMAGFVGDRGARNLLGTDAGKHADEARALLAKLGEGA